MGDTAQNYDEGKIPLQLLPPEALFEIAKGLQFGAEKYSDPYNWRKGMEWGRTFGSLKRHLEKWWGGEDIDEESGVHHLGLAGCRLLFLISYVVGKGGTDDRPPKM